ncbi:MAG: 2-oxoacid:acceptor oxidoreductase family protein [Candidatus Omnitrophota bacterium]
MMTEKIICAGFGGQGIMAMGKVLAMSAMREGKFVTWLPSYGAEVRGGTAHCSVVISDQEVSSPYVEKADTLIALNEPSLKRFQNCVGPKGFLLVNSSMTDCGSIKSGLNVACVPLTELAVKLGLERVANTIAIGVYLAKTRIISVATMEKAIEEILAYKSTLIDINKKALEEGFFWVQKYLK